MSKHTPGPWVVADSINGCTVHSEDTGLMIADNRNLAIVESCNANAKLTAAAPDLLEALQYALEVSQERLPLGEKWQADAIAAIAKAKGEQE